jgi:hypothetical protein
MRPLLSCLCVAGLAAADLPITAVTVLPAGLIIEREGAVPVGDEWITGLPSTLDQGSLSVEVEGHEVTTWRLVQAEVPPLKPVDPVAQVRQETAERSAKAAQQRASLAAAALTIRPGQEAPVLPGPEAIRAQIAFATLNAERASNDGLAASEAVDQAINGLAAAPGPAPAAPRLRVPGMGGKPVHLRYLLPGASWSPAWRLEPP